MAEEQKQSSMPRRGFLKMMGLGGSSAVLSGLASVQQVQAEPLESSYSLRQNSITDPGENALIRMQDDLRRALDKKPAERRWVMVIDQRKCVGCSACSIACISENKLPPGVVYRPVLENIVGTYPNVTRIFVPRPCMQCDNPPCTKVCPVSATYKNEEGVVVIDYDRCIGCRYCIAACPYGARTFDFGETYTQNTPDQVPALLGESSAAAYEHSVTYEYDRPLARSGKASPVDNVRKCHFCLHRLMAGMLPACTTTCIGRATYFGDANDPQSLVASLVASPNVTRLKEELGTEPRVYYLI